MDMSQHPSNKQIIVMDRNLNTMNNKLSGPLCRTQSCGIQTDSCLFQSAAANVDALKFGGTTSAQMTSHAAGASQIAKQVSVFGRRKTHAYFPFMNQTINAEYTASVVTQLGRFWDCSVDKLADRKVARTCWHYRPKIDAWQCSRILHESSRR